MRGRFFRVVFVRSHAERTAGDAHHVVERRRVDGRSVELRGRLFGFECDYIGHRKTLEIAA
jgi:hypothetical protein